MLGGCWTQLQKCAELYLMCDEIRRPQSIKKNTCISCAGETAVKSIPCSVSVFFSDFSSEHRTKGLIIPQFHLELFCQLSLIGRHEIVVLLEWSLRRLQLNMLYFFSCSETIWKWTIFGHLWNYQGPGWRIWMQCRKWCVIPRCEKSQTCRKL